MFTPGPWELVIILVVVAIVFGPNKLPQIGRDLGKGLRSFKRVADGQEEAPKGSSPPEEPSKRDDK